MPFGNVAVVIDGLAIVYYASTGQTDVALMYAAGYALGPTLLTAAKLVEKFVVFSEKFYLASKFSRLVNETIVTDAKVVEFIQQQGKVIEGFGLTIKKSDNSIATDLDIITSNEIIEVKNSMTVWEKKPDQVNRFVNSSLEDFVNPYNKKAILYIEKPLSDLNKTKILNTIPKNVTLVNSLTELKNILK